MLVKELIAVLSSGHILKSPGASDVLVRLKDGDYPIVKASVEGLEGSLILQVNRRSLNPLERDRRKQDRTLGTMGETNSPSGNTTAELSPEAYTEGLAASIDANRW